MPGHIETGEYDLVNQPGKIEKESWDRFDRLVYLTDQSETMATEHCES